MGRSRVLNYAFTPGAANAGTVKLQGRINLENILLIMNMTRGDILYNFSDATRGAFAWSHSATEQLTNVASNFEGVTTVTLEYATTGMAAGDKLAIYVEDMRDAVRFRPAEVYADPVDKLRVSTPQSLIDTDFEYSVQPGKWEQLGLVQSIQSIFPKGSAGNAFDISALTGDNAVPYSLMTITTATAHGLVAGDVVTIQETNNQLAEGTFVLQSASGTTATYYAKGQISGSVFATGLTTMSGGGIYDNSAIAMSSVVVTSDAAIPTLQKTATALTATPTVAAHTAVNTTATGTSGTPTITVASATGLYKGMLATASTFIPANTYITNIVGTTITLSANLLLAMSATAVSFQANQIGCRCVNLSSGTNVIPTYSAITVGTGITVPTEILELNGTTFAFIASSLTATLVTGASLTIATNALAGKNRVYLDNVNNLFNGVGISGTGISAGTTITGITSPYVTISANTTGAVSGAININGKNITVTTSAAHGLYPGSPILLTGVTGTLAPNGNWVITQVATPNTFVFQTPFYPTAAFTITSAKLYVRPEGYIQHRSLDGGVQITTGSNLVGPQQIRQTRRYFRYQSGKGIQFSTGVKFTPTYDVDNITASGTTATVTTFQDHNLAPGATVLIENVTVSTGTNTYNGTFTVATVTGTKTFTYTMSGTPTDTAPGGTEVFATCTGWKGSLVRSGLFDDQNGFYFEYDGANLFVGRRQSIKEMFGKVTCTLGSATVTGTGTRFRKQLIAGDKVVIKGMCYEISSVLSDTSMTINPSFRGPTASASQVKYTKVQNFLWPQTQWNLDKMDGSGPSGYILNVAKMQMAYIDYTWYGAGAIRFGFRGPQGDIVYVHKVANNNVNTSAYMRSGNLPGRFETYNYGRYSRLVSGATATKGAALAAADTTMYIEDATYWPSSGYVIVGDGTNVEIMSYSAIGAFNATAGGYPLTVGRRATMTIPGISIGGIYSQTAFSVTGTASSVTFTPDAGVGGAGTAQVNVNFLQTTCAPVVSHWGVSVIMDGRYDNDKEVRFVAGQLRYTTCVAGEIRPLLMIRIAPSVDSGIARNFGIRELVNRMQLTLKSVGVYSQGQFLIEGILNPSIISGGGWSSAANWTAVGSGSLAQVYYFDSTGTYSTTPVSATGSYSGGDRIFGFYTDNAGGVNYSATRSELDEVRDLGTSILAGDGSSVQWGYPNGPDILLISARSFGSPSFTSAASAGTAAAYTITMTQADGRITVGQRVSGTGVGANARVVSVSGTTITVDVANSGAVSGTLTFITVANIAARITWTEAQA